jgi:hypothetical protein
MMMTMSDDVLTPTMYQVNCYAAVATEAADHDGCPHGKSL